MLAEKLPLSSKRLDALNAEIDQISTANVSERVEIFEEVKKLIKVEFGNFSVNFYKGPDRENSIS